ncbi:MAG: type II toxin-antitoxin system VapC family toxin [Verrucomicrobia bacterium]|nr:type II toxin-antitoxin system VapC family toxin [Verrucomicrobiota bacterium]
MRIYIESTIPSYVVARPARDLLQAARQQLTRDWWEFRRAGHALFTSQLVLDEIAFGESEMANRRLELMADITLLASTGEAGELTRNIMKSRLLPPKAEGDGAHIALATVHEMDILLTWNCRHIANAFTLGRLRRLIESCGYSAPTICTPEEFLQEPYE